MDNRKVRIVERFSFGNRVFLGYMFFALYCVGPSGEGENMSGFNMDMVRAELTQDEGKILGAYTDSRGHLTCGVGRNLTTRGLSVEEVDFMLDNDIAMVVKVLDELFGWWRDKPDHVQRVMINLCFNLGYSKLMLFTNFLACMQRGAYSDASDELVNSVWWKQVGERGPRMVARLTQNVMIDPINV